MHIVGGVVKGRNKEIKLPAKWQGKRGTECILGLSFVLFSFSTNLSLPLFLLSRILRHLTH